MELDKVRVNLSFDWSDVFINNLNTFKKAQKTCDSQKTGLVFRLFSTKLREKNFQPRCSCGWFASENILLKMILEPFDLRNMIL